MIALYIICGIVLLIALLLNIPVAAELSYVDKKFSIKAKYLWIILYPFKEKKKKPKKVKHKKSKAKEKSKKKQSKPHINKKVTAYEKDVDKDYEKKISKEAKKNISKDQNKKRNFFDKREKLKKIKEIIKVCIKPLKHFIKNITISDLGIDFFVADEDACNAAINYGKINAAVYNGISFLRTFCNVSVKHINISVRYNSNESVYDCSGKIKVRPQTVIFVAVGILLRIVVNNKKQKLERNEIK